MGSKNSKKASGRGAKPPLFPRDRGSKFENEKGESNLHSDWKRRSQELSQKCPDFNELKQDENYAGYEKALSSVMEKDSSSNVEETWKALKNKRKQRHKLRAKLQERNPISKSPDCQNSSFRHTRTRSRNQRVDSAVSNFANVSESMKSSSSSSHNVAGTHGLNNANSPYPIIDGRESYQQAHITMQAATNSKARNKYAPTATGCNESKSNNMTSTPRVRETAVSSAPLQGTATPKTTTGPTSTTESSPLAPPLGPKTEAFCRPIATTPANNPVSAATTKKKPPDVFAAPLTIERNSARHDGGRGGDNRIPHDGDGMGAASQGTVESKQRLTERSRMMSQSSKYYTDNETEEESSPFDMDGGASSSFPRRQQQHQQVQAQDNEASYVAAAASTGHQQRTYAKEEKQSNGGDDGGGGGDGNTVIDHGKQEEKGGGGEGRRTKTVAEVVVAAGADDNLQGRVDSDGMQELTLRKHDGSNGNNDDDDDNDDDGGRHKSNLSAPLENMMIRQIFAPKICQDSNNWVSKETAWKRMLLIINVEREEYEEMEVSSNDLVWRIRQAYVRQSSSSESTRFLITLGDDRILQELDDSKELCEYKIGPTSPVYASTNLKTGDEMVLVD
mmetsp:Transcript_586/g.894  ORF Transcript_586/g.894 Transcript_586/m.894 type:complete len:618 (+) Transcript_586:87-1940(+)